MSYPTLMCFHLLLTIFFLLLEFIWKNDPYHIIKKTLSPEEKLRIVLMGPCQPLPDNLIGHKFPRDSNGRHFNELWYYRVLTDGSKIVRDWLTYSPKLNNIFCLPCILYGSRKNTASSRAWTQNGYSGWQNGRANIDAHELTDTHIGCSITLKTRQTSLPILPSLEYGRKIAVATSRQIISELINIVTYLATHNLAFRGHRESKKSKNKGNFKDLVTLMATNSPLLSSHIAAIEAKGKKESSFITWERQNQLIDSVAQSICLSIQREVTTARYFSISVDSTFDASRSEQISFIIRYVNDNGDISERLLALKESAKTTGEALYSIFDRIMIEKGFNWKLSLVGQSYDGAGNMSGQYKGLQARIKEENKHALFVWCHAHRLNLVVTAAVSKSNDALNLFGNLESLYAFLWTSKIRVSIFKSKQSKLYPGKQCMSMKRVSTTRWMSHSNALTTILNRFEAVLQCLEEIIIIEGPGDAKAASAANGFINYFQSFKFILSAYCFKAIFDVLGPLNGAFQQKDIDLLTATDLLKSANSGLKSLRSNTAFDKIVIETRIFIETSDRLFEPLKEVRIVRVPRKADENCLDDPITDPIFKMKVEMFYIVLDRTLSALKIRFNDDYVGILRDISLFSIKRIIEIKNNNAKLPLDRFDALCSCYQFIPKDLLVAEYIQFTQKYEDIVRNVNLPKKIHLNENKSSDSSDDCYSSSGSETDDDEENIQPLTIKHKSETKNSGSIDFLYKILFTSNMNSVFPYLYLALKIALTLPISSASTERSFSRLKIIKTRLRTSISQNRLENLLIISTENDIEVEKDDIIQHFSKKSSVLNKLLTM